MNVLLLAFVGALGSSVASSANLAGESVGIADLPVVGEVVQAPSIPPPPGWGPGGRPRAASGAPSNNPNPWTRWSRVGGYGGGRMRLGAVGSSLGLFFGGGGGVIVGPLSIGGAGYFLAEHSGNFSGANGLRYRLELGYGGVELGGTIISRRMFDFGVRSLIGFGGACLSSGSRDENCVDSTSYVALDPEVVLHLYANDSFRFAFAGGYRLALTHDWTGPDALKMSGPFLGFGVDFGRF
jgi:hypothetical protein